MQNLVTVTINGSVTYYALTVPRLLEAASDYKDLARSAGDTLVINGHRIQLSDIIELNMPGRRALAKRIVDDLKDATTWLSRVA
ncbi:hypothetical protein [Agrobacterium pusense]|uniref:hypothetical protein n=1 Tax=Agrobacterium pusense TaxID=648995 RepID=UPI000EC73552|nr:hypothetical protein [Agrobacterium sp.]